MQRQIDMPSKGKSGNKGLKSTQGRHAGEISGKSKRKGKELSFSTGRGKGQARIRVIDGEEYVYVYPNVGHADDMAIPQH